MTDLTMMNANIVLDTNILVYLYDLFEPEKREQATALVETLINNGNGAISTQVMVEFVSVVTRKLKTPLTPAEAYIRVEELIQTWQVIEVTPLTVLEAVRGVRDYGFSIWDAQIWATALLNKIPVVLSEDFNTESIIEGVRFVNPFLAGFDIAPLIHT